MSEPTMITAILDFEATGPDSEQDRITQVAIVRNDREPLCGYVNPGRPIPPVVVEKIGISDADVASASPFKWWAPKIGEYLKGVTAIVGFGCRRFDVPVLAEEFARVGYEFDWSGIEIIDCGILFQKMEPRTLEAAVQFYCGREHRGAHDAMLDVMETQAVLSAQLERYEVCKGKSLAELAALTKHDDRPEVADFHGKLVWIDGRLCYNTKRNKGVPVEEDIGYAQWMVRNDVPRTTIACLEKEFDRIAAAHRERMDETHPEMVGSLDADGRPEIPF